MPTTIVTPKEIKPGEDRIAMVPTVADKLSKSGIKVKIQRGLGANMYLEDSAFKDVDVVENVQELYAAGDVIVKVQPPTDEEISYMKNGAILISTLYPHTRPAILKKLCEKKIISFALEMVPRISRAQSMDILSSQATAIGYKAVLIAANSARFFLPMLSTAAGTLRPANVLIIGAGVAGLQAIATARRLGARVSAYDVRPETKQEVESLGAKFVEMEIKAVGEGGYARELTAEEKQKQQEMLAKHIAANDVVIATAGVPGRPAPKIISRAMVEKMKPGSVIVDTMAEMGGNCELSKAGQHVEHNGVLVVGTENIASSLAINTSEMFAKNILNFITPMLKDSEVSLDWKDEIISGSVATRDGNIIPDALKKLVEV
jgi:NAD(P) transhydrogenase subunit alpha